MGWWYGSLELQKSIVGQINHYSDFLYIFKFILTKYFIVFTLIAEVIMSPDLYTISEAADFLGVTRAAVWVAVKTKRINAFKVPYKHTERWVMKEQDLVYYNDHKYERRFLDRHKGEISLSEAAKKTWHQKPTSLLLSSQ